MKKGDIVAIFDGMLRVFIVMIIWNSVFAGWKGNVQFVVSSIGIVLSCFSVIYTYKNNVGRIGIGYFISIITECILIGLEVITGIIGKIVNVMIPIKVDDPAPGDGFLLIGYVLGVIIITNILRIIFGIKEFIRWYKDKDFLNN